MSDIIANFIFESCVSHYFSVILHHSVRDIRTAYEYHHSSGSGHGGIKQISRHEHGRTGVHRYYYDGILASLALMNGYGVCQLQFIKHIKRILDESVIKAYLQIFVLQINQLYFADIAVEQSNTRNATSPSLYRSCSLSALPCHLLERQRRVRSSLSSALRVGSYALEARN